MISNVEWDEIRKLWNADLQRPIVFRTREEAKPHIGDEIAAFDSSNNRIMVNEQKLEEVLGREFAPTVVSHEVGHYAMIPYDLATLLRLVNSADEVLKDVKLAKYVENLFADTVLNTFIFRNDKSLDKKIVRMYKKMGDGSSSGPDAWKLYLRSYEKLWRLPSDALVSGVSEKVDADAQKLADILEEEIFLEDKWEDKIKKYAEVMKPYVEQEKQQNDSGGQKQKKELGSGVIPVPQDPAKMKDIEGNIKKAAKEIGQKRIKRLVAGLGLGKPKFANRLFYEAKAQQYSVCLPTVNSSAGVEFPQSPRPWGPSDPVSDLDIAYSVQMAGRILPGFTYSWNKENGRTQGASKEHPDLFILLDTSASMGDPNKMESYSVISSMVAARCALNVGSRVAVINFSGQSLRLDYTRDRKSVDDVLLHHFDGGTVLPTGDMLAVVESSAKPQYLLLITDTAASNLDRALPCYKRALDRLAGGSLFLIGASPSDGKKFSRIGYEVTPIQDEKDLLGLTLKKARELYV